LQNCRQRESKIKKLDMVMYTHDFQKMRYNYNMTVYAQQYRNKSNLFYFKKI